ncbi:hypothetical protein ACJMK2_014120 [Sinanodonta woodiana]|uniref:Myosin light chain kinase, smooth muscle n=1 Tax=Sinanodonta woodiana TaxID=1069815 RepID=A0ABD3UZN9_SINWO
MEGYNVQWDCYVEGSMELVRYKTTDAQHVEETLRRQGFEGGFMQMSMSMPSDGIHQREAVDRAALDPPRFVTRPHDIVLPAGAEAVFECTVAGTPFPNVAWSKNGEPVYSGSRIKLQSSLEVHKLIISNVSYSDEGNYTCTLSSPAGTKTCTVTLTIADSVEKVTVEKSRSLRKSSSKFTVELKPEVKAISGDSVKLTCVIDNEIDNVRWKKNNRRLSLDDNIKITSETDGTQQLVINVVRPDDAGQYSCIVMTPDGNTITTTGELVVLADKEPVSPESSSATEPYFSDPLHDVHCKDGDAVTLECTVNGSPRPQITWYKDNVEILDSQDFQISNLGSKCCLHIVEVFPEDEGKYSCRAVNSAGEATTRCMLIVEGDSRNRSIDAGSVEFQVDTTTGKLIKEKRGSRERDDTKEKTPEFIIKPRRQFISSGETAKFKASFEGSLQTKLSWSKDGTTLVANKKYKMYRENEYFILEVVEAALEDQGVYTCTIQNSAGSAEVTADLEVFVRPPLNTSQTGFLAPTVDIPLEDIEVANNQRDVTLECKFSNAMDASTTWYKDGRKINSWQGKASFDGRTAQLVIREASRNDCGTFECVAKNTGGEAKTKGKLSLLDPRTKPEPPKFTKLLIDQTVKAGDKLVLEATVTGKPRPTIKWYKGKIELSSNPNVNTEYTNGKVRIIMNQMSQEDSATYTCVAENMAGKDQTKAEVQCSDDGATSDLREPPIFTKELSDMEVDDGDRVEMSVEVKGTPPIDIVWVHNNREIPISDPVCRMLHDGNVHSLVIPEVFPEDTGEYVCEAYNDFGDTDTFCRLVVREQPENSPDNSIAPPEFIIRPQSLSVNHDNSAIFTCQVAGTPLPRVEWMKEGKTIKNSNKYKVSNTGNEHSLEIYNTASEDMGIYSCIVTNEAGSTSADASLSVTVEITPTPPPTVLRSRPGISSLKQRSTESEKSDVSSDLDHSKRIFHSQPSEQSAQLTEKKSGGIIQLDFRGVLKNRTQRQPFTKTSELPKSNIISERESIKRFQSRNFKDVLNRKKELGETNISRSAELENGSKASVRHRRNINSSTTSKEKVQNKKENVVFNSKIERKVELKHVSDKQLEKLNKDSLFDKKSEKVLNGKSEKDLNVHLEKNNNSEESSVHQIDYRGILRKSRAKDQPTENTPIIYGAEQIDFRGLLSHHEQTSQKPEFKTKMSNQTINAGNSVTMETLVMGTPDPDIKWTANGQEIKESKFFRTTYENNIARLVIAEVFSEDEGEYCCIATNQSGTVKCSCDLSVQEINSQAEETDEDILPTPSPPKIYDISPAKFSILRGGSIEIRTSFSAVPAAEVTWYKNKSQLWSDGRLVIDTSEHFSTLYLNQVQPGDSGCYKVIVKNNLGCDSAKASLTVEDKPDPPVGKPFASDVNESSLTLSWYGPAYDGGCQILSYQVEACDAEEQLWRVVVSNIKDTSVHIQGLVPRTPYFFRVSAKNKHGMSSPGAVTDVVVMASRCSSLRLSIDSDDEIPFEHREVKLTMGRVFEELYELSHEVGKGKFGSVYKCIEKSTRNTWAAKIIKCREVDKVKIHQEIEIMNQLKHPKILMLWEVFEAPRKIILVMEYVGGGELFERIISENADLTEHDCVQFMRQICDGVAYMHNKNIIHLDLKPENILCVKDDSNKIKIIDFGLARFHTKGDSVRVLFGTPEFIAPEVVNYEEIGFETDMWSLGVICYVLLTGISPFMGDSDVETLSNVTRGDFDFEDVSFEQISDDAKDFILRLMVKNKKKRMTASQCLEHSWLARDEANRKKMRISTKNLRRFMARRKWQKTGNAIRALGRMAALQKMSKPQSSSSFGDSSTENSSCSSDSTISQDISMSVSSQMSSSSFSKVNDTEEVDENGSQSRQIALTSQLSPDKRNISVDELVPRDKTRHDSPDLYSRTKQIKDISDSSDLSNNNIDNVHTDVQSVTKGSVNNVKDKEIITKSETNFSNIAQGLSFFIKGMRNCKAFAGDVIRFDVTVSGELQPKITWFFEDDIILESPRHIIQHGDGGEYSLIIKNVNEDDDGEYSCKAENQHGEEICYAELIVYGAI